MEPLHITDPALPNLTQVVLLDRGQARAVYAYLRLEQRERLWRNPDAHQLSTTEALTLAPLAKLLTRLNRLRVLDQQPLPAPKPRKPGARAPKPREPKQHRLSMPYDQMTVLRYYYAHMLARAGAHPDNQAVLAAALGQFHQPSLSLERHIELPPANRLPPR